jgi:RNA polymerase sigma-70 factor (ECF subfamily)
MDTLIAPSLEDLWNHYNQRLQAFIRSRVSDPAEGEDILQDVFLRLHRLCCLPDHSKLDSYIYQIARNLIIDHYRKRKDLLEIPDSLPADESDDLPEDDPSAKLALSLKDMVYELPEIYRQALLLTEYEGLSQQELADRLGISLSGAKSRVQRARQMLRDMLLTCCHFELDRRNHVIDYYARCCRCTCTG